MARFALLLVCLVVTISSEATVVTIKPRIATTQYEVTKYGRAVWNAINRCAGIGYSHHVQDELYHCVIKHVRRKARECLLERHVDSDRLWSCVDEQRRLTDADSPAWFYEGCLSTYFC